MDIFGRSALDSHFSTRQPRPRVGRAGVVRQVDEVVGLLGQAIDEVVAGDITVRGELSRWTTAASGHCYGELRGRTSSLSLVMYRRSARRLESMPPVGSEVVARGRPAVYAPRSQIQFVAEDLLSLEGEGQWRWARARLLERLTEEGMLLPGRKRPLPNLPERIGLIAATESAAYQDVLTALSSRSPWVHVTHSPARVGGNGAAHELARAIGTLSEHRGVEVLVIARGGGDRHSLRTFDSEMVARAICRSSIPVVVAVGHAGDVAVADLVSDASAPTPTAAAEMVSLGRTEVCARLETASARLHAASVLVDQLDGQVADERVRLDTQLRAVVSGLRQRAWSFGRPRLDAYLNTTARQAQKDVAVSGSLLNDRLIAGLGRAAERAQRVDALVLTRLMDGAVRASTQEVERLSAAIDALAPERILSRGYAILRDEQRRIVRQPRTVTPGQELEVQLATGRLRVRAVVVDEGDAP